MDSVSHMLSGGHRKTPQQKRLLALIGVSCSLFIAVVCSSDVWSPFSGNVIYTKCSFTNVFRQLFHVSFESCVDECLLRRRCSLFQYNNAFKMCILSGDGDYPEVASSSSEELPCITANVADWDTLHLLSCSAHACDLTERCNIDAINTSVQCEPSECLIPPTVDHARLCSNAYGIGMKNGYCCEEGYVPVGNQSMTCLENGTWSNTNVVCKKTCPYPDEVPNVKLMYIIGDGLIEGTQLKFECKPGYLLVNVNETNLSSTCRANGRWRPNRFGCCEPGYKFHAGLCYRTFFNSTVTSYDEIDESCEDEGLRIAAMGLADHILNTETLNGTFMIEEQKDDLIRDVIKCIPYYNETGLEGTSLDEHLEFVWNNTLTCNITNGWAPSEPNGNDTEACLTYTGGGGTHQLQDYNCSFTADQQMSFACYVHYTI